VEITRLRLRAMGAVSSSACNQALPAEPVATLELLVEDCSSRTPCVDGKYRPGYVFGPVAKKELNRVGDVVDLCQSLERTAADDLLPLLVFETMSHVSLYEPEPLSLGYSQATTSRASEAR